MTPAPASYLSRFFDWLLQPVLDFAAPKLRNQARRYDPYRASFGDVPRTDDFKTLFHDAQIITGEQPNHVA